MLQRFSQNFFDNPTSGEPAIECAYIDFKNARPFRCCMFFLAHAQSYIATPVNGLFRHCCPSTVFFAVALIVVYAINGQAGPVSAFHVVQECSKRFEPSFADGYSPSSVPGIVVCFGICTSLDHSIPDVIERMGRHPMNFASTTKFFPLETATGPRVATNQVMLSHESYCTTVTSTKPLRVHLVLGFGSLNDCPSSKFVTNQVPVALVFREDYDVLRHGRFLPNRLCLGPHKEPQLLRGPNSMLIYNKCQPSPDPAGS